MVNIFRIKKFNRRQTLLLLERLALYCESGISINEALRLSQSGINQKQASLIGKIQIEVEAGGSLSAALVKQIGLNQSLSSLIAQGERSGNLASTLKSTQIILERQDELVKKCLSAMTYPVVIGICAIGLTLGLVRGVMPQIIPLLIGMKVTLPLLTRITIAFSDGLTSYGLWIFLIIVAFIVIFVYLYKRYYLIKRVSHQLVSVIPIVGSLVYSYSIALFVRSLGMLISSGADFTVAYIESCQSVTFEPLKHLVLSIGPDLEKGKPLSSMLTGRKIPVYVNSLILAGESSGTLGKTLDRAADIIERDIDFLLKRLTALIEPIMMIGMGGVVGGVALSIMLPIYDISKMLQHVR